MIFDFLLKAIRRIGRGGDHLVIDSIEDDESFDPQNPFPDVVVIKFRDILDLHSIPPRQVRAVVEGYLEEAHRRGVRWVRIIHGKGVGVQREIVRSVLSRTPFVVDYADAPPEAGGWGATVVTFQEPEAGDRNS
ncbi:MAG TPA: Smr/MutS family protein [Blastocatellia bacterium]|nr:Smr/MutS family protein [Blastocatellia bacterium]